MDGELSRSGRRGALGRAAVEIDEGGRRLNLSLGEVDTWRGEGDGIWSRGRTIIMNGKGLPDGSFMVIISWNGGLDWPLLAVDIPLMPHLLQRSADFLVSHLPAIPFLRGRIRGGKILVLRPGGQGLELVGTVIFLEGKFALIFEADNNFFLVRLVV
jgi:hypothetical protein